MLLALVGFAAVTQVRTNEVDDTYAGLREQDLIDVLNGLAGTTQRAETEIARLETTRDDLQSDTGARQAALAQARSRPQRWRPGRPGAGHRTGHPITITEVDGPVDVDPILDMIQELRTAGAEAIQINGEVRVVAQTSFEDGAGGILVDGQLVERAVRHRRDRRPPDTLVGALRFPDGPRDQFEEDDGAELTFEEPSSVDIETTRDPAEADVRRGPAVTFRQASRPPAPDREETACTPTT